MPISQCLCFPAAEQSLRLAGRQADAQQPLLRTLIACVSWSCRRRWQWSIPGVSFRFQSVGLCERLEAVELVCDRCIADARNPRLDA